MASMRWPKADHSSTMARAVSASASPAAVRYSFLPICSYSGSPTESDSSRNCIDTVGWVTWQALAAAVMLPCSASARNRRNWRKVIFIDLILWIS